MADEPSDAPDVAPQGKLDELPMLVVTRFSFLGSSGWKSEASRDAELLFEPARLARRFSLFRAVTLPSLAGQTDRGFHHLVLTSDQLPADMIAALQEACAAAYGDTDSFTVFARPPGPARRELRVFMNNRMEGANIIQIVVDDDDGLSTDFIANLRDQLRQLQEEKPDILGDLPYFLSFPHGYALSLRNGEQPEIFAHSFPFINLGLTMIGNENGKNILAIKHKSAPRRHGVRVVDKPRVFMRAVHDFNDSRVERGKQWREIESWRDDDDLRARFGYLMDDAAPWVDTDEAATE